MEGRLERDPEKFDQVSRLLGDLREAWDEICTT
jgi:flagellin-specific chaperone FliS